MPLRFISLELMFQLPPIVKHFTKTILFIQTLLTIYASYKQWLSSVFCGRLATCLPTPYGAPLMSTINVQSGYAEEELFSAL